MVGNPMNSSVINQLGSKSPNLQSPNAGGMQVNVGQMGGMVNSMSMSISNNGSQMNSMSGKIHIEFVHLYNIYFKLFITLYLGMNTIAQGNMSNMILTNSSMAGLGNSGNCMIKQQINAGPGMMNAGPGNVGHIGPTGMGSGVGGPNQNIHMGGPGHPQVMQNGPMMRMVGQQHMLRGPGPHLMGSNGPAGVSGGPRMQNPNITMGILKIFSLLFSHFIKALHLYFLISN